MTERGDEPSDHKSSLEDTVDRLDAKAAEEYDSDTRAEESTKRGSPDEPPD
ncbi:hypothetical protein [Mycolicibacter sinensis]|jgi:hypothetical protein|uniref:hypothetical protein n=1 Tax=Mycolicibacter sinensis (strain JDM601) TaxID=875328 RepID=UPI000B310EF9|nr:hypothetical protein [Mycolicibacter sinensis]